jgi:hypothetical protein
MVKMTKIIIIILTMFLVCSIGWLPAMASDEDDDWVPIPGMSAFYGTWIDEIAADKANPWYFVIDDSKITYSNGNVYQYRVIERHATHVAVILRGESTSYHDFSFDLFALTKSGKIFHGGCDDDIFEKIDSKTGRHLVNIIEDQWKYSRQNALLRYWKGQNSCRGTLYNIRLTKELDKRGIVNAFFIRKRFFH